MVDAGPRLASAVAMPAPATRSRRSSSHSSPTLFIRRWNAESTREDQVIWVAINQGDDPGTLSMFIRDARLRSARFAFDRDGASSKRWDVRALPTTLLVDRGGSILSRQEGYNALFT